MQNKIPAIVAFISLLGMLIFFNYEKPNIGIIEEDLCTYNLDFSNSTNILFIGTGQIARNNMPEMIQCIAASQGKTIDFETVASEGETIKGHWEKGEAFKKIHSRRWDYIVLQEASTWAIDTKMKEDFYEMIPLFLTEIKKVGAKPVFFGTYPREPDSIWYGTFLDTEDYKQMEDMTSYEYSIASRKLGVKLVPVSRYWTRILRKNVSEFLYDGDGKHPNMYGSYLTALVFSKYLANVDVNSPVWMPKESDINKIQKLLGVI